MQLQVETTIYKDGAIGHGINDAGTKATHYISWFDKRRGMQIHDRDTIGTGYNNYIQINSYDISMWRANKEKMRLNESALEFYCHDEDDIQHTLASYGEEINIYQIGTKTGDNGKEADDKAVITINSSGANIDGSVKIGNKEQSEYLNKNIQIGGRNLLIETKESQQLTKTNQNWFSPVIYKLSDFANTAIIDENYDTITFSFDYSITNVDTAFNMTASLRTESTGTYAAAVKVAEIPVGNSSGHAVGTRTITDKMRQYAPNYGVMISGSGNANANAKITISNMKLEFGNKATSWTPAPEDIDVHQYIDLTNEGLNIYYDGESVALYGQTTRIGNINGSAFYINDDELSAYDDSGHKYFEVSSSGIKFGNDIEVAQAQDIPTNISQLNNDSGYATTGEVNSATQNVANTYNTITQNMKNTMAYRGYCETVATDAAKVVNCTSFPSLVNGATITVYNTTANTVNGAITLNVNGTGAKTVYANGNVTSNTNKLYWAAGSSLTFVYGGSYWRLEQDLSGNRFAHVGQSADTTNVTTKPWFKVGSLLANVAYADYYITFHVEYYPDNQRNGKLRIRVRTDDNRKIAPGSCSINWISLSDQMSQHLDDFVLAYKADTADSTVELWTKVNQNWGSYNFRVEDESTRTAGGSINWQLYNTTTDGGYAAITSGYTPIASQSSVAYVYFNTADEGIKIHNAGSLDDYIQINSDDISMWRNKKMKMSLDDSNLVFYDGGGTDATNKLAQYGSTIQIFKPTTGVAAVTIDSTGATFDGKIQATSGFIGQNAANGFTISNSAIYNPSTKSTLNSDTIDGIYLGTNGIALGKGLFKVTLAGSLTAKSGTIGGWNISATALCSATTYSPGGSRILLAPGGVSISNAVGNLPAATYAITAGTNFGVTTGGTLYATGAQLAGAIDATSFIARYNNIKRTEVNATGLIVYKTDGETPLASIGNTITLGVENSGHISINSSGLYVYTNSTNKVADFDSYGIYLYYNDTDHRTKTIIGSSGITMYNNDSSHTTLAAIGSSGMRLYYNNSTNWKARVDEDGLYLYNNVSSSAKNYYKAYINSNGATFYNDSGTSSISMNVGSGDIRLTRDDVSLGTIGFNKDKNDNNLYGIELHLNRSTDTLHPGWVGITATNSAGENKYKLIYLQDNASIGNYTAGAINVDCDLDMNWFTIRDAYLASTTLKVISFQCLTGGYIAAGSFFYSGALSSGYSGTERIKGLVGYDLSGAGSGYCSVNTCKINPSDGTYEVKIVNHSTSHDATSVNLTIYLLVS